MSGQSVGKPGNWVLPVTTVYQNPGFRFFKQLGYVSQASLDAKF